MLASLKRLKRKKAVAALVAVSAFIGAVLSNVNNIYKSAVSLLDQFSEKLKIEEGVAAVYHEPWFYVLPPGNNTQPVPMWTFFHLTIHNRDSHNIWINDYLASAHTKDRNRWIELTPPPSGATFRLFPSELTTLKRQDDFNYNAASGPIAPDGYVRGWMFFGTCLAENVDKLEFEFHDKEGKAHRSQVGAGNLAFGGQLDKSATPSNIANLGGHQLDFDNPPSLQDDAANKQWALSPPVEAYVRRIRPYLSLFPDVYRESFVPGQIGVERCSKWTP